MKASTTFLIVAIAAALAGCSKEAQSARGFRLPKGDIERGKTAFTELRCNTCHTVAGVELPVVESSVPTKVVLGGVTMFTVKTYGELVTSIINPSHSVSKAYADAWARAGEEFEGNTEDVGTVSPMPQFNDVMTVSQMIDLATFLDSTYELREPEYNYVYP